MPSEDITFCANDKCNIQNCERNPKNIRNFNILHSFAMFPDCDKYPSMEFSEEHQEIKGE